MKFVEQPISIDIVDVGEREEQVRIHGSLLPNTIRAIICGPSNCGKTTALISLLLSPNGLCFENLYIYSKSLQQPKYQLLEEIFSSTPCIGYNTYANNAEIISPNEAKPNSVFIFDDVACDKQNIIREYFSMGRHNHIDSFYLCQSYSQIPKHLIRDNANFLIIFKQDAPNLNNIYRSHINSDMTYEDFLELCRESWGEEHGFVVVDKDSKPNEGRYRKGFNTFLNL